MLLVQKTTQVALSAKNNLRNAKIGKCGSCPRET